MHIYKIAIYIFIFFFISNTSAQNSEESNNKLYVTVNIASSIFEYSPRYKLGYITPFSERWMYGIQIGYNNYNLTHKHLKESIWIEDKYRLFEIRPSLYYVLNPKNKKNTVYLQSDLFYINQKDIYVNNTQELKEKRYINLSSNLYSNYLGYDKATFLRKKYGVNFNFGMLVVLWRDFGYDFNIGLGIRNRNINYTNIVNPVELNQTNEGGFITPMPLTETGNRMGLNANIDFKLYYKF